jgi:hypothetical protein
LPIVTASSRNAGSRPSLPWYRSVARPFARSGPVGCRTAIQRAEQIYSIPAGLLLAIGNVESGRLDPATGSMRPWPWTANAQGQGVFFDDASEAVDWVRRQQQGGMRLIDVGCMQINLWHHPNAFRSLEEAFDPTQNAEYAARFLQSLYHATGSWQTAIGYYHSQTTALAELYRKRVQAHYARNIMTPRQVILSKMEQAWQVTMGPGLGQGIASGASPTNPLCRFTTAPCGRP